MTSLFSRALIFATTAHASIDHRRKYTNEPYIVHPIEVATILSANGFDDEEMLSAALCHDVIEDTAIQYNYIAGELGNRVSSLVFELTTPVFIGNRELRHTQEVRRLATISPRAQTIKCADLISNTTNIVERDPDFARVYLREKADILDVLIKADKRLHRLATWHLMNGLAKLGLT